MSIEKELIKIKETIRMIESNNFNTIDGINELYQNLSTDQIDTIAKMDPKQRNDFMKSVGKSGFHSDIINSLSNKAFHHSTPVVIGKTLVKINPMYDQVIKEIYQTLFKFGLLTKEIDSRSWLPREGYVVGNTHLEEIVTQPKYTSNATGGYNINYTNNNNNNNNNNQSGVSSTPQQNVSGSTNNTQQIPQNTNNQQQTTPQPMVNSITPGYQGGDFVVQTLKNGRIKLVFDDEKQTNLIEMVIRLDRNTSHHLVTSFVNEIKKNNKIKSVMENDRVVVIEFN